MQFWLCIISIVVYFVYFIYWWGQHSLTSFIGFEMDCGIVFVSFWMNFMFLHRPCETLPFDSSMENLMILQNDSTLGIDLRSMLAPLSHTIPCLSVIICWRFVGSDFYKSRKWLPTAEACLSACGRPCLHIIFLKFILSNELSLKLDVFLVRQGSSLPKKAKPFSIICWTLFLLTDCWCLLGPLSGFSSG